MKPFQLVILGIFLLFILIGVLGFSGFIPLGGSDNSQVSGEVTLWGTVPQEVLAASLETFRRENEKQFALTYVEKRPATFDRELVEALASGTGPDMILLPQDLITRHSNKIFPVPYETYALSQFTSTFIEEGELFLRSDGSLAIPFSIDPLVMYWNRDIFTSAAIARPPQTWDEFFTLAPQITQIDEGLNITRSAVALGEFRNIDHAKDILALLILQAGNPIVEVRGGTTFSVLAQDRGLAVPPTDSATRFYTEFAHAGKAFYSWNRSLLSSKDAFIAGDLAMYFGYASERAEIEARSPHLNFDVALMPQVRDTQRTMTFGTMNSIAVMKTSRNIPTAIFATFLLTGRDFVASFTQENGLPPVRRDLLTTQPATTFGNVFNQSALISRAWIDPDPEETSIIFRDMIESVVSGKRRLREAVTRADEELTTLLK